MTLIGSRGARRADQRGGKFELFRRAGARSMIRLQALDATIIHEIDPSRLEKAVFHELTEEAMSRSCGIERPLGAGQLYGQSRAIRRSETSVSNRTQSTGATDQTSHEKSRPCGHPVTRTS